jgi:Cof subfamily protein (haloacid dehalogenase superfamily)
MKPIKLIIFDIDGTLLATGSDQVERSALAAIDALHQQGLRIAVATGRNYPFIKAVIRTQLHADFFITINGHCVLNQQAQLISRVPLQLNAVERLLKDAQRLNLPFAYKASHTMHVLHDYEQFYQIYAEGFEVRDLLQDNTNQPLDTLRTEPALGCFMMANDAMVERLRPRHPDFQFIRVAQERLDVFGANENKTVGIQTILDQLNLDWTEVMAFGDGTNDLEMLEKAGIGIAMGNAVDAIKAIADYVTAPVDQGGIAQALKHYHLIDSGSTDR